VDHREPEPETSDPGDGPEAEAGSEDSVEDSVEVEAPGRRYPSTIGGAFYLVVLAASGVGLAIVARGNWRLGVKWVATALVFAAVVRLVLPARDAGMLAVRRRALDVLLLVGVGLALWFLSSTIPNQPPL
jgi:hypothetical protein